MVDDVVKNTVEAIAKGRTDVILTLIETYGKAINQDNLKDPISLKSLLDSKATDSGTFLHYATQLNQTDIVRTLMLAGSDPSIKNEQNKTCYDLASTTEMQIVYLHEFMRVIALSCVSKIAQLLGSGFDVNSQKLIITRDSPLHWAATYADFNTVCFLLDKGADPNAVNCYGATPFHDAVIRGEPDIIEELLRHGADPNIKPKSGKYLEKLSPSGTDTDSILFPMRDDESDAEQNSDSTSSWINAGGSHDSLIVSCPPEIIQPPHLLELNDEPKNAAERTTDNQLTVVTNSFNVHTSNSTLKKLKEMCNLLWPKPRSIQIVNDQLFALAKELSIFVVGSIKHEIDYGEVVGVWETHSKLFSKSGVAFRYMGVCSKSQPPTGEGIVICHINSEILGNVSEAYTLLINSSEIKLVASDIKGLYYGVSLLGNYIKIFNEKMKIPAIKINDWPKKKFRGWVIDISPTNPNLKLDAIRREIDIASLFRFNYLLLHMTITHLFKDVEDFYFSPQEILNLEKYCSTRCIKLIPSIDLHSYANRVDEDIIRSINSYLKRFFNYGYIYVGPSLTRYFLHNTNSDLNYLFAERCLVLDTCFLDPSLSWLTRVPFNSILVSNSKYPDDYSTAFLIQRRLSYSGYVLNTALPCVLENSITGCSNLLFSTAHEAVKLNQSIENLIFIMAGISNQSSYHLLRSFYLPAMAFGGGIAWNPDFEINDVDGLVSTIINFKIFDSGEKFGDTIVQLCQIESSLRNIPNSENTALVYELVSNPNNVGLEHLNAEMIQRAVRELKICQNKMVIENVKDPFAQVVLEEIQLVADLMLFSLRLCRHLLNAGQNPNSYSPRSSLPSGLAVINVGLTNLPPPIRTDLANKLLELMRRFRKVSLQSHISKGLEQEGQPFYSIFQQLIFHNVASDILEV